MLSLGNIGLPIPVGHAGRPEKLARCSIPGNTALKLAGTARRVNAILGHFYL